MQNWILKMLSVNKTLMAIKAMITLFLLEKTLYWTERNSEVKKGHNSVINFRKMVCYNPNLDLVNINSYARFGKNPLIYTQDIEQNLNSDITQGP